MQYFYSTLTWSVLSIADHLTYARHTTQRGSNKLCHDVHSLFDEHLLNCRLCIVIVISCCISIGWLLDRRHSTARIFILGSLWSQDANNDRPWTRLTVRRDISFLQRSSFVSGTAQNCTASFRSLIYSHTRVFSHSAIWKPAVISTRS